MGLLFVCRANLIRSPMATSFLRSSLQEVGRGELCVTSAGLQVSPELGMGVEGARVARERGVELARLRPLQVTAQLLRRADLVLTMTEEQRSAVCRLQTGMVERTFTIVEVVRLLGSGEESMYEDWRHVARAAHAVRPHVARPPEHENVPDPVGTSADQHRIVADSLVRLTEAMAGHMAGVESRFRSL